MSKTHIMTITEKIASLRQMMFTHQLDAYIIPSTDPHQSEYVAPHWQARQWFSGFTDSAGVLVVTHNFAGLWTDSRYFLQAESQLADSEIRLMKLKIPHTPEYIEWMLANLPAASRVGFDGLMCSVELVNWMLERFSVKNFSVFSAKSGKAPLV